MKKKLLVLALLLAMLTAFVPWQRVEWPVAYAAGDFTIENGVLTKYNGSGGDVVMPKSVTCIGDFAFSNCTGLTGITIPDSLRGIGDGAFEGCTGLTDVTIPDAVSFIGAHAFFGCTGLTSITLPASAEYIIEYAFYGCDNLKDVYYHNTREQWDEINLQEGNDPLVNARRHCTNDPAAITAQPADTSGVVGDKVTFSVEAEGDDLSYQWYYKKAGDGNFTRWANHNAASASLQVYASWHNAEFYCMISDSRGNVLTSDTARLTVLPKITEQPRDASGAVGDTATFTVKATGTNISYQWYLKKASDSAFSAWNKKTTASVSTPIYKSWDGAQFYCVVTDINGATVKSNTVRLTVSAAAEGPEIHSQPVDANGKVGNTVSFVVQTWDRKATFQWYYRKAGENNFTLWKGQTKPTAVLTVYASWNQAEFYCILTGANGGTRKTDTVKLTVVPVFTEQPRNVSGVVNASATFAVKATGAGLTYQWYIKKANESDFTAWNKKTSSSVSTPIYASWNNAQIYCVITDANGKTVKSNSAMITVLPKITTQPQNVSGAVGENASFAIKATGAGISYQWYVRKSGESSFTAWNKKTAASVSTPIYKSWNGAQFYCVVKDNNGKTVQSNTATLTVK